ncbi:ATP-dependent RNA helicase TDRD12, partial [Trichonephila clavata]
KGNEIPQHFLQDKEIYVTIIEVKDPAHFIIKESPSIKSPRTLEFLKFEDAMQNYYKSIEQAFFPLPSRDALVVAHFENKYYRAKVCSILNMTRGHIIKVYLVDYGKQCNVTRPCLYEIPEDFLKLPFQAVDFRFDLKPISLVMDLNEITVDYGPVTEWDVSASTFINDLFKAMKNAFVKVKHADQGYVIGSMYVSLQNGEIKCINDELVLKKFAQERSKCMNNEIVLHPATDISVQKEKSILDSSQPVAVPTLISKPNENISSTQKLRALIKKRYRAQNGIKNSTDVEETIVPNNVSLESANKGKEFGANLSKQEELQKDIQPKQNENISSTQKLRALMKKRYRAQNCIKNSTDVKETIVPNNNVSLESANKGEEFGANLSKREELQKDIKHNHLEDTKDSNKVLKSTLYKSSTDFASSGSEVLTETNDISENITVDAVKKNLLEISERKARMEKFRIMFRKNRLRALAEGKENSSNVVVQTSEESHEINSTVKSEHKIESLTSEMKQNMTHETSCMKSDVETLICEPKENVITEASCMVKNPEQVIFAQDFFETNDSSSESQINRNLLEISERKARMEKFRIMFRKNRLRALAEGKENSSNVVVQTSEESHEINSTVKSEHKIESLTSEMKQNMTQETSCMKSDVETLICEPKENVIAEASCMVNNPEQVIFDQDFFEMNDSSSESQINSRRSSTSIESEVESQLNCERHENSVSVNFGPEDFGDNHIPAICLGKNVPDFVFSLSDISFSSILKKTLEKLNFEGPSSVQSAAWPAAKRNLSYAAIAPPHSGKTVGYLLPIVSNFLNQMYNGLPKTKGPVAIIICSSWKKVFAVQDLLNLFLDGFKLKILACFADGKSKRNRIVTLMNGCDILISIPSILLNLFKEDVICIKRCCHLILDDGTNLMADHIKEIKETIRMFSAKFKRENEQLIPLQIVINSERWTNSIASFVDNCMKNSFLLFTSYLEAAIHAQIPVIPHVCNESEKDNRLLSLIKANEGKTVVCTKEMDKALHIHSFLKSENVRSFLITEEMEHYISEGIIQDWKSVSSHLPYCLVSTDSALTVKIKEADCIIHYDVPEMSRLQFGYRFSCMTERLIKQDISKCESHILLSETCYSQAKALMKIIKRTGKEISKEMRDLVIKQEKIQCPPDVPLCHYFKAFGKCKLPICTKRHYISSVSDKPNIVPNEGDVHAMVTHMFDATHFYVKILRYLPPDGEQLLSMSCEYAKLGSNLRKYYSVESNRKVVKDPVVGENYIIRDSNKLAYRVKVLDLLNLEETKCQKITLLYRDEGFIRSYDHWELFEDIDFGCLPSPHAVEVYLCNVCTPDSCPEWNAQANHFVKELVLNKEVHGKIALCLGETLFLHPFALREKMKFVDDYVNILSVESSLIKDGFARENKKHIETLNIACKNKIPLPNIKKTNPPPENATEFKPEISYAFLEMNAYEDVYVSSVISPQQVYVQRVKFVKCLEELLEKINAKVAAGKVKKCPTLLNGMHCIAPFDEDNKYYRAVVTNVSPDNDDVQLFFVDFGDSCYSPKDSIYDLSPEFMLLPFQAIECELDGISAPHGGWSDKCIEYFTDLTKDEEGCMKILELK